jgi:hypothetical protein
MRRKPGPLAALVMVAMAALISTGCSNGSADNSNPGAGSSAGTSAGTGTGSSGGSKNATSMVRGEEKGRPAEHDLFAVSVASWSMARGTAGIALSRGIVVLSTTPCGREDSNLHELALTGT